MEVYGAPSEESKITESSPSELDTMSVRSCYPESKRICECLCASYASQYGVPAKVVRLTQTFGHGVEYSDKRVFAEFARSVIEKKNIVLKGYHCHIGSQIFEKRSFELAAEKVMDFSAYIKKKLGFEVSELNMGGGFGVWYNEEDPKLKSADYENYLKALIKTIKEKADEHGLKLPYLLIEPGRSIVGEAGITLYTVGAIKEIKGVKKYVAVDGGMFDNPRYALYQSKYSVLLANRAKEPCTEKVTVAGKCCESGDLIAVDVSLPEAKEGDVMAVLTTGAYNYSMASNYNRNFIPAAVLVKDGKADYIIKPQTYEDIVRNDLIPESLKK